MINVPLVLVGAGLKGRCPSSRNCKKVTFNIHWVTLTVAGTYAMKYAPTYRLGRYAVPRAERVLEYGPDAKLLNLVLWVKALN